MTRARWIVRALASRCGARAWPLTMMLAIGLASARAIAAPFVPTEDGQVLERLPVSPRDSSAHRLQALRRQLTQRPDNLALATQVAWRFIEQGRTLSDPRYYGYAQAALSPWWNDPAPPTPVLVLRATVRQHDHDFDRALVDLTLALQHDPDNAQAWLTQALIFQVQGEYDAARRSCMEALSRVTPLLAVTCVSSVDSLNGAATPAYDMLRGAFSRAPTALAGERVWALTVLAEIAARQGRASVAEEHFTQAQAVGIRDAYLLGAYADFLLDQHRPHEVAALLRDETRVDALLLRLAIAEKRIAEPAFAEHAATLRARFEAARLRGESVHLREEARFALECLGDPHAALALARQNWSVQREPSDARVLLASAVAAGNFAAALPAVEFVEHAGLEDTHLRQLSAQLRGPPP